jgi:hypothetical protein
MSDDRDDDRPAPEPDYIRGPDPAFPCEDCGRPMAAVPGRPGEHICLYFDYHGLRRQDTDFNRGALRLLKTLRRALLCLEDFIAEHDDGVCCICNHCHCWPEESQEIIEGLMGLRWALTVGVGQLGGAVVQPSDAPVVKPAG